MKNTSNKKTITQQRMSSSKLLQLLCAIFAFLLDVAVILIILLQTSEIKFMICPAVLAVLDLVFIVKVICSSYRFSYARNGVLIHMVCIIAVCVYSVLSTGILEKRTVFVDIALYAMPAVHLIQCIAALFNAFHMANRQKVFHKITAIALTVLFAASVGLYGRFLVLDGFFGQGNVREERMVTYELDDSQKFYTVTGILDGKGNSVTIPKTFNDLPVKAVDCNLFTHEDIEYVTFNCNTDINFLNVGSLRRVNKNICIEASKNDIDAFRNEFYEMALQNREILELANNIVPSDMKTGEVYITFTYTYEDLELVDGHIIPTWFGSKGDVFNIYTHAGNIPYIDNSNVESSEDLYWCCENQNRQIFRAPTDAEGYDVNGIAVGASGSYGLDFDTVYEIVFADDNDSKYDIDKSYTKFNIGGVEQNYRLVTADRASDIIEAVPERNGFDLKWYIGSDRRELSDTDEIVDTLSSLEELGFYSLEVYPEWSMNAPTINSLLAEYKTNPDSAIYGENVILNSTATAPHSDISLSYEWKFDDVIGDSEDYTIQNIHPTDAGQYTLSVTAYSDTSSLTNTVKETVDVSFTKKELNFSWILPEGGDLMYSFSDKPVAAVWSGEDVINNDVIDFILDKTSVKNAGDHSINLTLLGDTATKYYVPETDATATVTIVPYELNVKWLENNSSGSNFDYIYNGKAQYPEPEDIGVNGETNIGIYIKEEKDNHKNVGTYTVTAGIDNSNYTIKGNSQKSYRIDPKPITSITWGVSDTFTYNGTEQYVRVTNLGGVVSTDNMSSIIGMLQYSGGQTNVGDDYTVSVAFEEIVGIPCNYCFPSTLDVTKNYKIIPRNISIIISNLDKTYSGTTFSDFTFDIQNRVQSQKNEEILSLVYGGDAITAVNVGTYKIESANIIPGEEFNNYNVTEVVSGDLVIGKKDMKVTVNSVTKTYDGKIYSGGYSFEQEGLTVYDTIDEVFTISYEGNAISAKNASSTGYTIRPTHVAGEKYGNYNIEWKNGTLIIEKAPLTVTATNHSKVYDGAYYDEASFGYTAEGLVNGETKESLGEPDFSSRATSEYRVGTYVIEVSIPQNTASNNYEITYVSGECTITPKPLTITVSGGSKEYDRQPAGVSEFDFSADGLVSRDSKSSLGTPQYVGDALSNRNVGTYSVNISGFSSDVADNYDITYIESSFTINPKAVSVRVNNISKTYDGRNGGNFDFTIYGIVTGDEKSSFGTPSYGGAATINSDVGTYSITLSLPGNDNYTITQYVPGTLTINKKAMTVTPVGQKREYDGTVGGVFSVTATGMVSGETVSQLGEMSYGSAAVTAKDAGVHTLTVTFDTNGSVAKNYDITIKQGSFEITKKQLVVNAIVYNITYGDNVSSMLSHSVSGLVSGETEEMLGSAHYNNEALTAKNVGKYTLTVSYDQNSVTKNYNIVCNGAQFEIMKKDLSVSVTADDFTYGQSIADNYDYIVSGLIDGETADMLGNPILNSEAANAKNVGTYTITLSFGTNNVTKNYNIVCDSDQFEITRKDLTVSVTANDITYGQSISGNYTYEVTGLAGGDTKQTLGTAVLNSEAANAKNVGGYTISVTLPDNTATRNYNISYESDYFEIVKKDVTVTLSVSPLTYGESVADKISYSVSGLVYGETKSVLGTVTYNSDALNAKNVGEYTLSAVSFSGGENYNIICGSVQFEIKQRTLVITAIAEDRDYVAGMVGGNFSYDISGLIAGDSSYLGAPVYGGNAVNAENAGTYTLSVSFPQFTMAGNYDIEYVDDNGFVIRAVEPETTGGQEG